VLHMYRVVAVFATVHVGYVIKVPRSKVGCIMIWVANPQATFHARTKATAYRTGESVR